MPFSLVDSEEFHELLQEMDSKYQVPYRKGISRDQQNIQSSTGNNSIVVEQSRNH